MISACSKKSEHHPAAMASTASFKIALLCLVASALGQDSNINLSKPSAVPQLILGGASLLSQSYDGERERTTPQPQEVDEELETKLFEEQARNAVYSFGSSIVDGINDNSQSRTESRNGRKVEGSFTTSDGFFNRTVIYEADENGYRILKDTMVPVGDGPKFDINGRIDVSATIDGQNFGYSITKDDIKALQDKAPAKAETKSIL